MLNILILYILFVVGVGMSMDSCHQNSKFSGGTRPTDHWPTVENAEACKLQFCSREI